MFLTNDFDEKSILKDTVQILFKKLLTTQSEETKTSKNGKASKYMESNMVMNPGYSLAFGVFKNNAPKFGLTRLGIHSFSKLPGSFYCSQGYNHYGPASTSVVFKVWFMEPCHGFMRSKLVL